jgi:hypothetical protein
MYGCFFCGCGFSVGWRLEITDSRGLKILYCCQKCKEVEDEKVRTQAQNNEASHFAR